MFQGSTVAAISTGLSDSGIGIVRISGPDAVLVGDRIFRSPSGKAVLKSSPSHFLQYGFAVDSDISGSDPHWKDHIIDEVMAVVMSAPKSYTGEDTVEIQCHGGVLVMRRILEASLRCGAVLAQPGEFTKRAFLNGRIDLSEAEAVMDVIRSRNEYALSASVKQLRGDLAEAIRKLRGEILHETAFIEAALDNPEHISLDGYSERLHEKIEDLSGRIKKLLDTADNGRFIKEGIDTVIVGKPNVGKSSLLNLLVGQERAIVTDVAGTTRDILEESVNLNGIGLNVIDTAGIRDTQDTVEKIGVERARKYAKEADLVIYVADSSVPLDDNDREILSLIGRKKVIILLNKSDLESEVSEEKLTDFLKETLPDRKDLSVIRTSVRENTGMKEFEDTVREMFFQGGLSYNDEIVITNMRHKEALQNSYESLLLVKQSIENGMEEDFYSIDLTNAYAELGKIIGEELNDDVVEEIFSKFCMGK